MPSIKELRGKVRSLKSTSKITSAMKLVSSSKLKKAQDAWTRNLLYADSLRDLVSRLMQGNTSLNSPLIQKPTQVKHISVLVLSSDKGLCGGFNSNLLKTVQAKVKGEWKDYEIDMIVVGKKGSEFFTRRCPMPNLESLPGMPAKVPYSMAQDLGARCLKKLLTRTTKKSQIVYLAYNQYNSMISQTPVIEQLLPIVVDNLHTKANQSYLLEPEENVIYERIFPQLVHANIFRAMLSNAFGEHAARMNAMDNATRNSKDLINRYTLIMNRARQSAITTELTEIVAGAESLKG